MKRDMELIRQIAFAVEEREESIDSADMSILGFTREQVDYHCLLMGEAGLVHLEEGSFDSGVIISSLTWAGHDFADAARNDLLWNKVMKQVKEKTTSLAFDGLVLLLKNYGQQLVNQGMGWVTGTPVVP